MDQTVEVNIGVQNVAREIALETDASADEVAKAIDAALAEGGVLRLTDTKGRAILVPGRALGWVQVGESEKSRVGFTQI
ncbi:DUF3107 domain-containing protein [Knoellia sp. CPCC 206435]|uniref:DUF3107 domain-containing protein n=1 Tax=Knoellia terrae TaxID=3404797 RepID=UPI003B4345C3